MARGVRVHKIKRRARQLIGVARASTQKRALAFSQLREADFGAINSA